jgi:hypothetical protein
MSVRDSISIKSLLFTTRDTMSTQAETNEIQDEFDQFLNDAFPEPVSICWHMYHPADALKRLDPDAYANLKAAWLADQSKVTLQLVPREVTK